jgi:mono/diheme cytochrome c family protein
VIPSHSKRRRRGEGAARGIRAIVRPSVICVPLWLSLSVVAAGCRQDMHDQPRYKPLARSEFFGDERSARPLVADTVARGHLRDDDQLYTGKIDGKPVATFPFPVTREVLARGQERFDIYCSPCHDRRGTGDGMIVRRGYKRPPTFHSDQARQLPVGFFFDVITNGFGAMPDYAAQVPVEDRWAIVAYIRVLQLSRHATVEDVPADERARLDAPAEPAKVHE